MFKTILLAGALALSRSVTTSQLPYIDSYRSYNGEFGDVNNYDEARSPSFDINNNQGCFLGYTATWFDYPYNFVDWSNGGDYKDNTTYFDAYVFSKFVASYTFDTSLDTRQNLPRDNNLIFSQPENTFVTLYRSYSYQTNSGDTLRDNYTLAISSDRQLKYYFTRKPLCTFDSTQAIQQHDWELYDLGTLDNSLRGFSSTGILSEDTGDDYLGDYRSLFYINSNVATQSYFDTSYYYNSQEYVFYNTLVVVDLNFDYQTIYNEGYSMGFDDGYVEGVDSGYYTGYDIGYADGSYSGTNFGTLLFTIADVPVYYLRSLFNIQLFGVKVYVAVFGLMTAVLVTWLFRRLL